MVDQPGTSSHHVELSLFQLADPEVLANPYPLYARLRTEDPVHWDPYLHAWVVTRYADVQMILQRFTAARTPTPEQLTSLGLQHLNPVAAVMVKQMLFLDPPSHSRVRALAAAAFAPTRANALRAHIHKIVDHLLDAVMPQKRLDLMGDFASPLPAIVTAELLGVPVTDHPLLKSWSASFAEVLGNFQHNPDRAVELLKSVEAMTLYFHQAVSEARRRASPEDGLVASMAHAEVDGERLTDEEIVANLIVTMVGGQETTTNLIGTGVLTLLRNPNAWKALRNDVSLIPSAIEELLRYESPSQHTARLAPDDLEVGGRLIRRGEAVIAVMGAANRDPDRFLDPDRLDILRSDNRHLSFGWGAHFCFGAPLARVEANCALLALTTRLPSLSLTGEELVWRNNSGLRGLVALPLRF